MLRLEALHKNRITVILQRWRFSFAVKEEVFVKSADVTNIIVDIFDRMHYTKNNKQSFGRIQHAKTHFASASGTKNKTQDL